MPTQSWLAGALLLCAAVLTGGCSEGPRVASAGGVAPEAGGTVVVAAQSDFDHLNSLVSAERYTQEVLRYALFLPLVHYDSDLSYLPALASSWELEGDTAVVFTLRRDVRWHDGAPTTADDVSFTFRRARDTATAFPNAEQLERWRDVAVLDSFTVRFTFDSHAEPLAALPFLPIMPRHLLDTVPSARMRNAAFNRRPVGNGPFRFVEHRPGDRWVFEANPDFPAELGGRPYLDRLIWRIIPDGTAQITELRTGNADLVLAPTPEQFAELSLDPGFQGILRPARQYAFVGWNGARPPLSDPRVRLALTLALDRVQMIQALRSGHGTLAVGPIGPYHWAYDSTLEPLPHAPDSAITLLASAGWRDRDGDGLVENPAGGPLEIELKHPSGSAFNRDMAELIRAHLAAVGVRLRTRALEWNVLVGDILSPERRFDGVLMGWESDFRLNLRGLFHGAERGNPMAFASYSNPEVDAILDETAALTDRGRAAERYSRLQRIMRDEQPWTFLYYYPDLYVASGRLRGVEMDVRGALLTLPRWWIPAGMRAPAVARPRSDSVDRSRRPVAAPPQ